MTRSHALTSQRRWHEQLIPNGERSKPAIAERNNEQTMIDLRGISKTGLKTTYALHKAFSSTGSGSWTKSEILNNLFTLGTVYWQLNILTDRFIIHNDLYLNYLSITGLIKVPDPNSIQPLLALHPILFQSYCFLKANSIKFLKNSILRSF
jgi:hypothetical protein